MRSSRGWCVILWVVCLPAWKEVTVEYLTAEEAARQRKRTLLLMANPPNKVGDLIDEFAEKIEAHAEN